ncbi:hypothetical protein AgCh_000156 [Apium graveolens]
MFTLVAGRENIRLLIALSRKEDWEVHHLDVKSAFLSKELLKEVYVMQPEGFKKKGQEQNCANCQCMALYVLRQARACNSKLLKNKEFKDHNKQQDEREDVRVKIPFLDKDNYHHWKVKMHLYLLSQDEAYVDCIERGPYVPMRAATGNEPSVPKPRHEWSDPDIEQVGKDKKAMNILFNGVDGDMFDNIINCKTAKEVWDTIQIP